MIAGAVDTLQDQAKAALGRVLEQGEVFLSTGQVARVHRTNALHDVRVDQLVTQAGYNAHGVDAVTAMRFRALLAVATLDGKPVDWLRGQRQAMDSWVSRFTSGDADRISYKFAVLHGYKPEQSSPAAASGHSHTPGGLP